VEVDPELLQELRELIEALDRRVPRVERAGESAIARDAAVLRSTAVKRLHELTSELEAAELDGRRLEQGRSEPQEPPGN
jgi:hypothetical protein